MILLGTTVYVAGVFYILFYMQTTKQNGCFEKYLKDKKAVQSDLVTKHDITALSEDECNGIVYNFRQKFSKDHKASLLETTPNTNYTSCLIQQFEEGNEFDAHLKMHLFKELGDSSLVEAARREILEIQIDSAGGCGNADLFNL